MNITSFTLTGGRPIKEDSYAHMQSGIMEAFANMLKATGTSRPEGVILFGCEITLTTTAVSNDTAEITAGAVYIDGEIYTVDAASGIQRGAGDTFVFNVVSTTASPSLTYFDATTQNPHLVRKAELTFVASGGASAYMPYDADTWQERLHGTRKFWGATVVDDDGAGGSLTLNSDAVYYQHNYANNTLHLEVRMSVTVVNADTAYILLQLPTDRDGDQLKTPLAATVSGIGVEGGNVVLVENHTDRSYLKIRKIDGADFAVGSLGAINFNLDLMTTI
jgi:hypothetical protein